MSPKLFIEVDAGKEQPGVKVLDQYLSDTYGKITKGAAFDNYYHYTTPKGEILARISKDNIISVYELKHRFGSEEY